MKRNSLFTKLFAMMLCVATVMSCLSFSAFAANDAWEGDIDVVETEPEVILPSGNAELKFAGANLVLESDLTVNFMIWDKVLADGAYTDVRMEFCVGENNEENKVIVTEYTRGVTYQGNTLLQFACKGVSPYEMNDTIYATLYGTYAGKEYSISMTYTAADYCYNQLGKVTDAKLRTLIVDLLYYGTAHQVYMKQTSATPVNSRLTEEQKAERTTAVPELESILNQAYVTVENPTASFAGATLVLNEAVEIQYLIPSTVNLEGVTLKIKAGQQEWEIEASNFELKGAYYYVSFTGLKANQMRVPVEATIMRDGVAASNTLLYSIETYGARARLNVNSTEALLNLVDAMMRYGDSAQKYFAK